MNYHSIDYSALERDYSAKTKRAGQQISIGVILFVIDFILNVGFLFPIGVFLVTIGVFFLKISVKEHKLKAFAKDNGGIFTSSQSIEDRRSVLFLNSPDNSRIRRLVSLPSGIEIGNLMVANELNKSLYYSFVKFPLKKPVPRFLIKKRWSLTSPTHDFASSGYDLIRPKRNWQKVSTTHQFTELFQVYTEEGDMRAVHGILAPDVMAKIVDHAKIYDLELLGNECYLIAEGMIDFSNIAKMRGIMAVIEAIEPDLNQEIVKVIR